MKEKPAVISPLGHKNAEVTDKSTGYIWLESRPIFNEFSESMEFVLVIEDNDVNRNIFKHQ